MEIRSIYWESSGKLPHGYFQELFDWDFGTEPGSLLVFFQDFLRIFLSVAQAMIDFRSCAEPKGHGQP
jgi:hypothetical protein